MKYFKFILGVLFVIALTQTLIEFFSTNGEFKAIILSEFLGFILFGWIAYNLLLSPFKKSKSNQAS